MNYSAEDVSLFIKDDQDNIVKLYGDPKISIGPDEPDAPINGDLWWCSDDDDGSLYVYYDEGESGSAQWVPATPIKDPEEFAVLKTDTTIQVMVGKLRGPETVAVDDDTTLATKGYVDAAIAAALAAG